MSQQDLQAAITSLEASTSAINRQSEILRTQREYLDSVQRQRTEDNSQLRAGQLASQNLALAVEEGRETIASQLYEVEERLRGAINQTPSLVTDYLRHDDHYLQQISALSMLDPDDGNDSKQKVAKLAMKLSDLTREEIECRLDRVYLQHLTKNAAGRDYEQPEPDIHELELDLKSLHVEIADVATMSTTQDFQAPLLRALARRQHGRDNRARAVLDDISNSMTILNESAETCVSRLEALQSFQTMVSAYQADFDALAHKFRTEADTATQRKNPRPVLRSPAMEDVLKHWNVLVTHGTLVEHALWARKGKVEQDVRRSNLTVEETLQAHLNRLPMSSEVIVEKDSGAETKLMKFEQDMQKLRDAMDRVNLARTAEEDSAKALFIERWAKLS